MVTNNTIYNNTMVVYYHNGKNETICIDVVTIMSFQTLYKIF